MSVVSTDRIRAITVTLLLTSTTLTASATVPDPAHAGRTVDGAHEQVSRMSAVDEHIALAMAEEYSVPPDQARDWAQAQEGFFLLAEEIAEADPSIWGGSRIDHRKSTLIINSTDPDRTRDLLGNAQSSRGVRYEVRRVEFSMEELTAKSNRLGSDLERLGIETQTLTMPGPNEILLTVARSDLRALEELRSRDPDQFRGVRLEPVDHLPEKIYGPARSLPVP